jgi:hypothetical protein
MQEHTAAFCLHCMHTRGFFFTYLRGRAHGLRAQTGRAAHARHRHRHVGRAARGQLSGAALQRVGRATLAGRGRTSAGAWAMGAGDGTGERETHAGAPRPPMQGRHNMSTQCWRCTDFSRMLALLIQATMHGRNANE